VALFIITLPALFLIMLSMRPAPTPDPLLALAAKHEVDPVALGSGRFTFLSNCAVCHGPDGKGLPLLGKPLRNSEFIQTHSDEEILSVIFNGRDPSDPANTTGTPMPARGLNPTVSDRRLRDVVVYLRTLQDPDEPFASIEEWIASAPAGGGASGDVSAIGHDVFIASCSACHGPSGEGLPNLGKPLATSEFVASMTDDELIAFVKQGRPIWDPDNTTGVDMPPKGGNPALNDDQIREIVAYIRALHDNAGQ
jgi:disulfide bond formation protein DsbB